MNNFSSFPRSDSKKILHSPGKLDRMKSILRHPSFSSKKPSTIPSLTRSPSKLNLEKVLPTIPKTPSGLENSKSVKHVNWTPDTVNKHSATAENSPSPIKSGIPRSISKIAMKARSLDQPESMDVEYSTIINHLGPGVQKDKVEYPSLPSPRPLPQPPRQLASEQRPPPSIPGTFTFRSDHTINFGASPKGFGSSPGQASVRQVRPSIAPRSVPGSFPDANKENVENLPSIPHGMANKKRRRVESNGEEEPVSERSPKKHKSTAAEGPMLMAPRIMAEKMASKSSIPSPAKKKGLSLSRLNLLARPKMRK